MGLNKNDKLPAGITPGEAYAAIRKWYKENAGQKLAGRDDDYAKASIDLVGTLPPPGKAMPEEIMAVLFEVVFGNLEWAYHQSDGQFKMAAYTHAALSAGGRIVQRSLTMDEKEHLKGRSKLWPHLCSSNQRIQ